MPLKIDKGLLRATWDFFVLFSGISTASNLSRTQRGPVRRRGLFLYRPSPPAKPIDPPDPPLDPTPEPPISPAFQPEFPGPAQPTELVVRVAFRPGSGASDFRILAGDAAPNSSASALTRQSGGNRTSAPPLTSIGSFRSEIRFPVGQVPLPPQMPVPALVSGAGLPKAAAAPQVPKATAPPQVPQVIVKSDI